MFQNTKENPIDTQFNHNYHQSYNFECIYCELTSSNASLYIVSAQGMYIKINWKNSN